MSLGLRVRETQQLEQSVELSQEQRLLVHGYIFALRMELIRELRGERYQPKARCPRCSRDLTAIEIIRGFNQNPNDFTTSCSACGERFEPQLICFGDGTRIELPFFCSAQTLAMLHGLYALKPEKFASEHPAIYRSAIVHHGSVRRAFEKIGIAYAYEDIGDWKNKIRSFLGRLPDTVIAQCVDVPVRKIRDIRHNLGVPRYTLRNAITEVASQ